MTLALSPRYLGLVAALLFSGLATQLMAETFTVRMMTTDDAFPGQSNFFDPPILQIQPGDTVIFEPTQSGHNSASKKGMLPDGVESWNGKIDKPTEITFSADGTYGYVCSPHATQGMVGLVLVGDYAVNLEQARSVKQRGKAKSTFRNLFEQIDAL